MEDQSADTDLILKTNFEVTSADTDMYGRLRAGALVNYLIQAAIRSADNLGFGFGGVRRQQLFWVLSRLRVEIGMAPRWYQHLEVETWPKDKDRLLYLRDFIVREEGGAVVARATSGWLAVDIHTRRPRNIEGLEAALFDQLRLKHALEAPPEKLAPLREGTLHQRQATYFDLDLNRHVTSTRYVDWMMDVLPPDFHALHYPSVLTVNYLKETGFGDGISLWCRETSAGDYDFDGLHAHTGASSFRGRIRFG